MKYFQIFLKKQQYQTCKMKNTGLSNLILIFGIILVFKQLAEGQNFPVGHQTVTFSDPARNNRLIATEIYYPSTVAGENAPVAPGDFPVLAFGHGFQMGFDSYLYLKSALVPLGYFFVLPKTESSLAPSHAEFGADLAFLIKKMKMEGQNPTSPFYQHVDSASAIMGHSMGGGSSFLACQDNNEPTVMVTLAAAETTPSAIHAAGDITIPSLLFSADKDCVTPPAQHQIPMYDSLASDCKVLINIKGGGHCYFADANFICSLGEIGCPAFTISREQQHSATLDFMIPYLDYYLKNNAAAWQVFNDSLLASSRITYMKNCTQTHLESLVSEGVLKITPNPVIDRFTISGFDPSVKNCDLAIFSSAGRIVARFLIFPGQCGETSQTLPEAILPGLYFVQIISGERVYHLRFMKY